MTAYLDAVERDAPPEVGGVAVSRVIAGDGVKYAFDDDGWLLHRLSGTEPMVRLYCEHRDDETVQRVLAAAEERLHEFARGLRS